MSTSPWSPDNIPDLAGLRALVTGATSGIGAAVVAALAQAGAEVLMAARDRGRLDRSVHDVRRERPSAQVRPLLVDLADLTSVRRAADEARRLGPLHLLVNNAGVMAPPYQRTVDGFELQLGTNHLGHFALTGLLWPALVAGEARVVTVSSQGHRLARSAPLDDPRRHPTRYRRWSAYAQSKLANLLFTFELDRRSHARHLPVTATAAHPGASATALMRSGGILDAGFRLIGQPPAMGAWPVLLAATGDVPGGIYVGPNGPGEMRGWPTMVGTSKLARDPAAARRLWEISERATGVQYP